MKFLKNQIDFYFISQVLLVRTLSLLDKAPNYVVECIIQKR